MLRRNIPVLSVPEFSKLHPWISLYTKVIDTRLATLAGVQQSAKDPTWANLILSPTTDDPAINWCQCVYSISDTSAGMSWSNLHETPDKYFLPVTKALLGVAKDLGRRADIMLKMGNNPRPVTNTPDYVDTLLENPWLLDTLSNVLGRTDHASIRSPENTGVVKSITMSKFGKHPFAFVVLKDRQEKTGNIAGLLKVGADGACGCDIIGNLDREGTDPAFFDQLFDRVPAIVKDMADYQRTLTHPSLTASEQHIAYNNKWLKPLLTFMTDNKVEIVDLYERETHDSRLCLHVVVNYTSPYDQERAENLEVCCFKPKEGRICDDWVNPLVQNVWSHTAANDWPLRQLLRTFKPEPA